MRILVCFQDNYRAYRDVIASGIRILRPHAEVETADADALEEERTRLSRRWLSAVDPAQRTRTTDSHGSNSP